MLIQMHIAELYTTLEEVIVVLKDSAEERSLPIWVAKHDAALIVAAIENILVPRPLTHELMADLIRRLGARLERVEISDLCENTYSALIHLSKYNEAIVLDARPGDAIAIAVRTNVPIFVRGTARRIFGRRPLRPSSFRQGGQGAMGGHSRKSGSG
jgi:hypothetical protein